MANPCPVLAVVRRSSAVIKSVRRLNMRSFAVILAVAWPAIFGAANAGEIVIRPKAPDSDVVLVITGGKLGESTPAETASAGEIVIKPKFSESAVVLTISGGKLVKASVMAKPEQMAKPEPLRNTAVFARTP